MTSDLRPVRRTDRLLAVIGVVLSVPPLISLIHRQFALPIAPDIDQFIASYRSMGDAIGSVMYAPLNSISIVPPPPLLDLHVLSFAGMGMMSKGVERPGERADWVGAITWMLVSFVCAYLLLGILVFGAILAMLIAKPLIAFRSDHYIETTPLLEGLQGRLRREREMRLERDLARIMATSIGLVGAYFALNALLLGKP